MKTSLLKYKIGLAVLLLFTVGLMVFVLMQAGATKQDTKTYNAANTISDKLNSYIAENELIPSSLTMAGARNVPSTITYTKISDTSYKFCATYKASSSNFDATGAAIDLATGSPADTSSDSFTDNTDLFIDTSHHKGTDCQTIKPIGLATATSPITTCTFSKGVECPLIPANNGSQTSSPYSQNSDGSYTVCGVHANYYEGQFHVASKVSGLPGDVSANAVSSPYAGAYQLFMFTSGSKVFDQNCNQLGESDLHKGDTVEIFDSTSANTDAVSIFLKQ